MKKSILFLSLLAFLISSFILRGSDSTIFLAEETDPYLKASFSHEAELKALLAKPLHEEFTKKFDAEFAQDFDTEVAFESIKTTNVDEWEMQLFDTRNKQMSFLNSAENYGSFSADFTDLIQANINYNYWYKLLAYSINRSNENTGLHYVTSLPGIMTESLDPDRISNPKRLWSKSYRAFLPYFVTYFNSADKKFKKYADGLKSVSDKADYAAKYLKGEVLDYTLTKLLEQNHVLLSTSSFRFWTSQIYCQNLQEYLSDNFFEKVLEAEKSREDKLAKAEKAKEEEKDSKLPKLMDLDDKSFTFSKYKGKVIYLDFWASWCGPCRAQFPFSKKMHEQLTDKQKEQIVFLYISIDKDIDKWKAAAKKLGLTEIGENGHSYEVAGKYQVSSIPRYMIINQKGEVVNNKAPRPSNPETLPALLELLK